METTETLEDKSLCWRLLTHFKPLLKRLLIIPYLIIAGFIFNAGYFYILIWIVWVLGICELLNNAANIKWFWIAMIQFTGLFTLLSLSKNEQLLVMGVVFSNDIGAYFIGKYATILPDKKIFPKISRNKTWRGFIAGIIIGTTVGMLLISHFKMNWAYIILSLFACLGATAGDCLGSKYKRVHYLDDSGDNFWTKKLMFGHGGVYDRFGALAMASPFFLLMTKFF